MTIEGYKSIAAELERLWGRSVSEDAVWRYANGHDPLPASLARGRVWIAREDLEEWAARQVTRKAPPKPTAQEAFSFAVPAK